MCFLCLELPKERIRILNYSCLICIKKGKVNNQNSTYCHKETGWVTNEKFCLKSCCKVEIDQMGLRNNHWIRAVIGKS